MQMSVKKKKNHYSDMTFFFRKRTNFVHRRASCFLDNSDVESDSEVVQKKRKRVIIYSESDGEDESDDEGPRAKIDVKAKNDEIGIIVEKSL